MSDHDVSEHLMVQCELLNDILMAETEVEYIPGL